MRGDEGHLEAADEEAGGEQKVALMTEGLAQGRADGLLYIRVLLSPGIGIAAQRNGEDRHDQHHRRHDQQRVRPAKRVDQHLAEGRENEHAGGARRRAQPEGERALFGRDIARKRRQHDTEGT